MNTQPSPRLITTRLRTPGRGFSLIELMVAMAIGLVIVLVIGNLFLGTKQNFRNQDDAQRIQENLRFASQVIGRSLRHAGYRATWNQPLDQVFTSGTVGVAAVPFTAGFSIGGIDNNGANASDTLEVRFQGSGTGTSALNCEVANSCAGADGAIHDCLGNAVDWQMGAGTGLGISWVSNIFQVRSPGANGGPALFCSIDGGTNWVEIVPDIENMQIVYGEVTGSLPSVERFLPAGTATQVMSRVIAVRIALLHRSANLTTGIPDTKTYNMVGTSIGPFNDQRLRTLATTTVSLRNRTQ